MRDGSIRLRTTKTASGATAVQAVRYVHRTLVMVKHFGSAHTPAALQVLLRDGEAWLARQRTQPALRLTWEESVSPSLVDLDRLTFRETQHLFAYEVLHHVLSTLGFTRILDCITIDLVIMRLVEPSSKRRAIGLLRRHFGIVHGERTIYQTLKACASHKEAVERKLVMHATKEGALPLSLVLYDVTTLYFESFKEDMEETGLRKTGFSKDNKPQQPQIVLGLLVTPEGFPLHYKIFKGNTFEGHTMLPVLEEFSRQHDVASCIVVADAGMLSFENITALCTKNLFYIVGARVANLSPKLIEHISTALGQKDGATIRIKTKQGDLICAFSAERYRKDKHDMEKQIARAKSLVASGEGGRRVKFVLKKGSAFSFHEKLVEKTARLLGIKGYVTNIPESIMSNEEIITHYRNLWHVEQTFRMSKSDLEMRPVFHHRNDAICAHILLCVVALGAQKHLEQVTGISLRQIRDALLSVTDIMLTDTVTGRTFSKRSALSEETKLIAVKVGLSH